MMTDCISNLPKCRAECCRTFTINLPTPLPHGMRGRTIKVTIPTMTDDKRWYYRLHGVECEGDVLTLELKGYTQLTSRKLFFYRVCRMLLPDNTCAGHPDDYPQVCKDLNEENAHNGNFQITPNCIFRRTT